MKKKTGFVIGILLLLILTALGYFGIAKYFEKRFLPNSWIDDLYITGKTVEEVKQDLDAAATIPVFTVHYGDFTEHISMEDCDIAFTFEEQLKKRLDSQNNINWLAALTNKKDSYISRRYTFDTAKLKECFDSFGFVCEAGEEPEVYLFYDAQKGFDFFDNHTNRLDTEQAYERLLEAVSEERYLVELDDCTKDVPYSSLEQEMLRRWKEIDAFLSRSITFDLGDETYTLSRLDLSKLLLNADMLPKMEDGQFVIDREKSDALTEEILAPYNTLETMCSFQATRGEIVEVPYVLYGTEIDMEAEKNWLYETLSDTNYEAVVHIPKYRKEAYHRGLNDIGPTYIEVDMTAQMLYFYKDGELTLQTSVVTGNETKKRSTPVGINAIYAKQKNRTLKGPGYASFVKFWMPINKGVGLHDASWRKEFGADIYVSGGSHGCINMPGDIAEELYAYAEIGMPVLTFY